MEQAIVDLILIVKWAYIGLGALTLWAIRL
jgi:hypothetical protein